MKKAIALSTLALSTFAFSHSVFADTYEQNSPSIYTGIGYGQYAFESNNPENDMDFDDDSQMLKGYIGTQFNQYFSVELAYQNFDEISDIDNSAEIDGVSLAARLSAPLTENFSIYAKGGWLEWDADYTQSSAVGEVTTSLDGGDTFMGAGLEYAFTQDVQMRLEYERYQLEHDIETDMDVASVSIQYMF
ncbi:outer membrane beta-barrel protein [Pseudoalteromonas sp. MMG010]|uniref:outer membrane beta-barrel protein n=1 Tax=Pseudoalteromonas sp. MMG010 TaxID=2822685 RepID=UPI001B3A01F4|nr:outer membrane beta-barrel protein [Pseudoalteromonas sp. MMG010]MBQ4832443.1 outer membrane beta-barrel protein [Pseudoalteromonas sp. MMG010]